jgi:hypothetical protein
MLELNDQEAARIRTGNPHLWRQLIDRGFIDGNGRASKRWLTDPRNVPQ